MNRLARELGRPPLHHGRVLRVRLAAVDAPERAIAQEARRLEQRGGFRDREAHALVAGERTSKRRALAHVPHRLLERDLRDSETRERDRDAVVIESPHHLLETAALRADQMRAGDPDGVEAQHGSPDRVGAHVAQRAARDAGRIQRDHERAHVPHT